MTDYKSTLIFENYLVNKAAYYLNTNFNPESESDSLDVNFDIRAKVVFKDNDIQVILEADIGEIENEYCPFIIEVRVTGFFSYDGIISNEEDSFIPNLLAILFPYLRSIISELSVKSNIFPDYRLPLMNLYSFLKESDQIEITGLNSED